MAFKGKIFLLGHEPSYVSTKLWIDETTIVHFGLNVFNHFTKNSLLHFVFTFILGTENKLRSNTDENKLEILSFSIPGDVTKKRDLKNWNTETNYYLI